MARAGHLQNGGDRPFHIAITYSYNGAANTSQDRTRREMECVNQTLQKLACVAAVALLTAGSLSACARAPQRRPDGNLPGVTSGATTDMGESVKGTISTVSGANPAEAVVLGNVVLVALNLDSAPTDGFDKGPGPAPGGMGGTRGTTPLATPGGGATAPAAPSTTAGTSGLTNVGVGQPGGAITPGTTVPGGSPTGTGAVPNATGAPGMVGTSTGATTNAVGQTGTPMDLYTKVADVIKARHPWVSEVRFAVDRNDAHRLASIANQMRNGTPVTHHLDELYALATRMSPTSTTSLDQTPAFGAPTPGRSATSPVPGTLPGTTTPGTTTTPPATGAPGLPAGR